MYKEVIKKIDYEVPGLGDFTVELRDEVIMQYVKEEGMLEQIETAKKSKMSAIIQVKPKDGIARFIRYFSKESDPGLVMISGPDDFEASSIMCLKIQSDLLGLVPQKCGVTNG